MRTEAGNEEALSYLLMEFSTRYMHRNTAVQGRAILWTGSIDCVEILHGFIFICKSRLDVYGREKQEETVQDRNENKPLKEVESLRLMKKLSQTKLTCQKPLEIYSHPHDSTVIQMTKLLEKNYQHYSLFTVYLPNILENGYICICVCVYRILG